MTGNQAARQHARNDLLCSQGRNADLVQPEIQVFHVALVIFDVDRPMSVRHVFFLTFGKSADPKATERPKLGGKYGAYYETS